MAPIVTVLMPVYNGEKYLREAVDSILNQTFNDFEFLIIDDGSTDSTWDILKSYSDPRLSLIRNKKNLKQPASMNKGLSLAKGKYIARMDADDVSLPKRLERQVAFMDKHPDIGVCGTWVKMFGNKQDRILRHPVSSIEARIGLLFGGCLCHPSVLLRNSFLKKYNLSYDPAFATAEDYELWVRCSYIFKIANIPEILLNYRVHEQQLSFLHIRKQKYLAKNVRKPLIEALKISVSEEDIELHDKLAWSQYEASKEFIVKAEMWFYKLIKANNEAMIYPEPQFSNFLSKKFFHVHYRTNKLTNFFLYSFYKPQINDSNKIGCLSRLKFRILGIREAILFVIKTNK